ncbi:uncharacterized protein LOC121430589 [Lytechinus variegatus]|uniref:uncharacterized protein LOC121430589 n=1 Tax=Lytechinus variegatus TaxID=7654 RepID=UPI001BB17D75|nr:uncharacterized protein LOC121430589 [Lytechinus variegatus]
MYQSRITIVLFVILLTRFSIGVITDVHLVGGPDSNKGTIEIKIDNGTWETVCGNNTNYTDVMLICQKLGFKGASRAIQETPYGQNSTPNHGLLCDKDDTNLSDCSVANSTECSVAAAASCHGEGYLGCFLDMRFDQVLSGESLIDKLMTISYCIQFCNESTTANYTFAGVEYRDECYCGEASDNYTRHGVRADEKCQLACSGDSTESCGGDGHITVFRIHTETSETTSTIGSTWSTEEIQEESPQTEVMTYQPSSDKTSDHSPRDELTSSPLTTTFSPTLQQYCNSSYFGAVVGEGVVIIILSVLLIVSVIYNIRIRKMMKDSNKDQKTQHVDLIQSSSSPESDTSFYRNIQDIRESDPSATSDGDGYYSSQIYK